MFDKLNKLKDKGYIPSTILDIGAHHGNWTNQMLDIYPTSNYYLFEAINYEELNRFENHQNIKIYKDIILNDKIEEVDWYEMRNTGDSFFKELTSHFVNCKQYKRQTIDLDTIILKDNILQNNNILIKIDCQGAEISILKGATSIFNRTDFIILEMPLFGQYNKDVPNFAEHINYLDSIGFIAYDIVDKHYINGFNMQVDMIFINKTSVVYSLFICEPTIHSIMVSNWERVHVINYIKEKKKAQRYTVLDIGGSADYTNWSYSVIDYIADINQIKQDHSLIKYIKINVNFESEWDILFKFVEEHGKFDFCICSHLIEYISLPQVLLNNLKNIAKEGFISIPSKYRELSKIEGDYLGYIHHRWIYSLKNNKLIGFPKVNFIEYEPLLVNIGNPDNNIQDLSFFWKNDINYSIINNNYLGPNVKSVKSYYTELLLDDVDLLNKFTTPLLTFNNINLYHINTIKYYNEIIGDFIFIIMLTENLVNDLHLIDNFGYIPFDIINQNEIGVMDFTILFINKKHPYSEDILWK